jgi:alpha-tubulin suppressor-like RCC1 family protein
VDDMDAKPVLVTAAAPPKAPKPSYLTQPIIKPRPLTPSKLEAPPPVLEITTQELVPAEGLVWVPLADAVESLGSIDPKPARSWLRGWVIQAPPRADERVPVRVLGIGEAVETCYLHPSCLVPRAGNERTVNNLASLDCINDMSLADALDAAMERHDEYLAGGVILVAVPVPEQAGPRPPTVLVDFSPQPVSAAKEQKQPSAVESAFLNAYDPWTIPNSTLTSGAEEGRDRVLPAVGLSPHTSACPHIASLVDNALRQALAYGVNQSVVLTGESGSGKSLTFRRGLRYVAAFSLAKRGQNSGSFDPRVAIRRAEAILNRPADLDSISGEQYLLFATDVLHRMTCFSQPASKCSSAAHTRVSLGLNRLGMLVQARVDLHMAGADVLVDGTSSHWPRGSFVVLYQMLSGLDAAEKQEALLRPSQQYRFLKHARATATDVIEDAHEFQPLVHLLQACGLNASKRSSIWKLFSAVLLMGNLRIISEPVRPGDTPSKGPRNRWVFHDESDAADLCTLLGLDSLNDLVDAIVESATSRLPGFRAASPSRTRGSSGSPSPSAEDLAAEMELCARELFVSVVQYLVATFNSELERLCAWKGSEAAAQVRGTVTLFDGPGLGNIGRLNVATCPAVDPAGDGRAAAAARTHDGFVSDTPTLGSISTLLCNYAAERLEAIVREMTVELDMGIYDAEGIRVGIPRSALPPGNDNLLRLFEERGAPPGIFAVLEDVSRYASVAESSRAARGARGHGAFRDSSPASSPSGGTGGSFSPMERSLSKLSRNARCKVTETTIAYGGAARPVLLVSHTHGDVLYSCSSFTRGIRALSLPHIPALLATSTVVFVKNIATVILESNAEVSGHAAADSHCSPWLAEELEWLAEDRDILMCSEPHVVRCIRSASMSGGRAPMHDIVDQLEWGQVSPTIAMRAHGFPFRSPFPEFFERYVVLDTQALAMFGPKLQPIPKDGTPEQAARVAIVQRSMCEMLAKSIWESWLSRLASLPSMEREDALQVGKTRMFMTDWAFLRLEDMRRKFTLTLEHAATKIQALVRGMLARSNLARLWRAAAVIQTVYRSWRDRGSYLYHLHHAKILAQFVSTKLVRARFLKCRWAVSKLKAAWAKFKQRQHFLRLRIAIIQAHVIARGFLVRNAILAKHRRVLQLQRAARNFLVRNRVYWARVRGALLLQALFRGYKVRQSILPIVERLKDFRVRAAKVRFFRRVAAMWRGKLIRRRLLEIVVSAKKIQRWFLPKLSKVLFWRSWHAAIKIQAAFRGAKARRDFANFLAIAMSAERSWSIQRVRVAEADACERMGERLHSLSFWQHISGADPGLVGSPAAVKRATFMTRPVDIDVLGDASGPHGVATLNVAENLEDGLPVDDADLQAAGFGEPKALVRDIAGNQGGATWVSSFERIEAELAAVGSHCLRVADGVAHSLALSSDGRLFTWGWNDRGQLGNGDRTGTLSPRLVRTLSSHASSMRGIPRVNPSWMPGTQIVAVAAGADHCVAVSSAGTVYTWGANSRGQCGLGHRNDVVHPTAWADMRRKASACAAGAHHTLVMTQSGSVYSCGACEAAGAETDVDALLPSKEGSHLEHHDQLLPVGLGVLSMHRIVKIACGWGHSVALASSGDMFTWGDGHRGQLGWGRRGVRMAPVLVPLGESVMHWDEEGGDDHRSEGLDGRKRSLEELALEQECAQRDALARAERDAAYQRRLEWHRAAMDREVVAELKGRATKSRAMVEFSMPSTLQCVDIACGGFHTLALTADGFVLAFGANEYGQLGLGDTTDRLSPAWVRGPWVQNGPREIITSIAAGWRHSVVLSSQQKLYSWGHCGSISEADARHELDLPLDGSRPESFVTPIFRTKPAVVRLSSAQGYAAQRLECTRSPSRSATMVTFSTQRTTDAMVRSVLSRIARQAHDLTKEEELMAPTASTKAKEAPVDPVEDAQLEAEATAAMLRGHPELRQEYARTIVAQRKRAQQERATRAKCRAAGLSSREEDAVVRSAAEAETDSERTVRAAIEDYKAEMLLQRRLKQEEMRRGPSSPRKGSRELALSRRWKRMTIPQRFLALGLSERHLGLLDHEQLSKLAFALRQESHEAARPFLGTIFGGRTVTTQVQSLAEELNKYAIRVDEPSAAAVVRSPKKPTTAELAIARSRSELLAFHSVTLSVEERAKETSKAARRRARASLASPIMLLKDQQGVKSSQVTLSSSQRLLASDTDARVHSVDHAGVLLAGGRYDVAQEQLKAAERLREFHVQNELKARRAKETARQRQEWRDAVSHGTRVDTAALFATDKIVSASQNARKHGRSLRQGWADHAHMQVRPTAAGKVRTVMETAVQATKSLHDE